MRVVPVYLRMQEAEERGADGGGEGSEGRRVQGTRAPWRVYTVIVAPVDFPPTSLLNYSCAFPNCS